MSQPVSEFSRLVSVARLGSEPLRQEIEATAVERERLARRFDLLALDRLSAVVTLERQAGGLIRLEAVFDAAFTQECVVILEPVAGSLNRSFALLYGPSQDEQDEIELDAEEPVFEPLTADAIDVGEAVAQELSLALPEFPRLPDAAIETVTIAEPEDGPFTGLANLRRPPHH